MFLIYGVPLSFLQAFYSLKWLIKFALASKNRTEMHKCFSFRTKQVGIEVDANKDFRSRPKWGTQAPLYFAKGISRERPKFFHWEPFSLPVPHPTQPPFTFYFHVIPLPLGASLDPPLDLSWRSIPGRRKYLKAWNLKPSTSCKVKLFSTPPRTHKAISRPVLS